MWIGLKEFWGVRRKGLFVIFYIKGMIEGKVQDADMQKSNIFCTDGWKSFFFIISLFTKKV